MNRRTGGLVAAAAAVGGIGIAVVPQHASSIVALAGATVVVVLAVFALVLVGPLVEREIPVTELDGEAAAGAPPLDPPALRDARRDLASPTVGRVPRPIWERLVVASVLGLQRRGIDVDAPDNRSQGQAVLSAETWTLLTTPPDHVDGSGPGPRHPAAVAAVVHRTLDELDALAAVPAGPTGGSHGHR